MQGFISSFRLFPFCVSLTLHYGNGILFTTVTGKVEDHVLLPFVQEEI